MSPAPSPPWHLEQSSVYGSWWGVAVGWEAQREEGYKSCALLSQWPPGGQQMHRAIARAGGFHFALFVFCLDQLLGSGLGL